MSIEFDNCWDSPIETYVGPLETRIRDEYGRQVMEAVGRIGIQIDKEGLIEALNSDKRRYAKAYQDGWNACEEYYKEKLARIRKEAEC